VKAARFLLLVFCLPFFSSLNMSAEPPSVDWLPMPVNRGGAEGLRKAAKRVTGIELVDPASGAVRWTLTSSDMDRLLGLVRGGRASRDSLTMAPPPWPVILVFRLRSRGSYAAHLVGHGSLRVNLEDPVSSGIVGQEGIRWVAQELFLPDEDLWLWNLMEERFGPSTVKQYGIAELPGGYREDDDMTPSIEKISFSTIGKGGRAFVEFSSDGSAHGGHFSARVPPLVHEDRGTLDPADRRRLWEAADAVLREKIAPAPPDPRGGETRQVLEISLTGSDPFILSWKDEGSRPAHEKVTALMDLILKLRVGGW
jgi:hypothetical protein